MHNISSWGSHEPKGPDADVTFPFIDWGCSAVAKVLSPISHGIAYRQDNEQREHEPGGGSLSSRFGRAAIVLNSLSSPSGPLAARLASNSSTSPPRARRRTASRCAASASSRRTRWWRGRTTRRVRGPHPPPSSPPRSKTVSRARSRMTSDLQIYPGLIQT